MALLCFPDWIESTYGATFAGGDWEATLPLTNLRDRALSKVARSSDLLTSSTQFTVDLIRQRSVHVIALPGHNFTLDAHVRIRGSNVSGDFTDPEYDSDWSGVFGVMLDTESLPTGHPSKASGRLSQDEFEATEYDFGWTHVLSTATTARYWQVEINDPGNSDGYVEIGRLVMALAWGVSIAAGAQVGFETSATRTESDGGRFIFDDRPVRRTIVAQVPELTVGNGFNLSDMVRRHGISKQWYFVLDEDDATNLHRTSFLCTAREVSALEWAHALNQNIPIQLLEEVAVHASRPSIDYLGAVTFSRASDATYVELT